jgi:hypothetical protein
MFDEIGRIVKAVVFQVGWSSLLVDVRGTASMSPALASLVVELLLFSDCYRYLFGRILAVHCTLCWVY